MRQDIEVAKTRLLVNTVLIASQPADTDSNKKIKDSWNDYLTGLFPFREKIEKTEDQDAKEFLRKQVAQGPLVVREIKEKFKKR